MKNLLLIVANGSRARLLRVRGGVLEEIEHLDHPESRSPTRALVSDRPGRFADDTGGHTQRSAMDPGEDAHELSLLAFAREVARRIALVARRGRHPGILLIAPPRVLGRVKAALEPAIARRVTASISHDYTAKHNAELVAVLEGLGVPAALPVPG